MSKSIALGLLGAGALLLAALLTGCSDAPSPTPSAGAVPTPTVTTQSGVTPAPTPTMAPRNTPTPEPTPAAATLSLYEYLAQCAPPEEELADDATYGDVSVLAAELIQRLEAMVPPADLVEWHHLYIEGFRTVQAMYDRFPKDDVIDNAKMDEFLLAVAPDLEEKYSDLEEKLSEVAVRLPEHLRQQMIEVDCLDPDIVPDDYDEPDDHGNNFESATRIAIGEAAAIELEFRLDKDVLVFLAEPGTEYEFTLDWESYSRLRHTARPILALFDAGGQELARLNHYVFGSQDKMMWQAVTRGDYYIVVGDTVTDGSITLTVTDGEATEQLDRDDATVAPTHTPTPAAATLSLDEYLTYCAPSEQELADDATFGDLSSLIAAEADRLEGVTPPAQLSEWHLLNIEGFRTIQAVVDLQPKDDVIDFANFILIAAASADFEEKIIEAATRLPEDVRQQMIEAGCIDPADVPYDYEDVPDDHGNDIDDATAIRVGTEVRGELEYDGDFDFFRFQAEAGWSYQIDVALGTLDDSIVELYAADGSFLDANDDYGGTSASRLSWRASSSGERYVTVEGYGIGSYTLTVSIIDDHGNDFASATRIAIWEAVAVELEEIDDIDVLVFLARPGTEYVLTLNWESYSFRESYTPRPILALFDADGQEHTRLMGYDFSENRVQSIDLMWQAVTGGDYYIVVGDGNTDGTFTLTVTGGEVTEQLDRDDHRDTPENSTNAGNTSYDTDGDGLIEVSDLRQLNAIRWDLDGHGSPSSNATGYNAAFPDAVAGMGCPDSGCSGYELISDLDFDTNGNGRADAGDDYWNDGEGWLPIGDDINNAAFKTFFNGGGHTISNLYIDRRDARYIGLFGITWFDGISRGRVELNNSIRDLALVNVDVQGGLHTGGLAGANNIVIVACSVTGVVNGIIQVGGLVGDNSNGTVIASYSTASVGYAGGGFGEGGFGGLVGNNHFGTINASYSIGSVTSDFGEVGGLVGRTSNFADRGTARASYWNTQTSGQSESAGGEGKTTSELQSPTGYTGIYESWNLDLDGDGNGDDLWDFGNASQYPTLRHGS